MTLSSVDGVLLLGFYLEMSRKRPLEDYEACASYSRKGNRKYCPHCDQSLSVKTFKTHKRLYFDEVRHATPYMPPPPPHTHTPPLNTIFIYFDPGPFTLTFQKKILWSSICNRDELEYSDFTEENEHANDVLPSSDLQFDDISCPAIVLLAPDEVEDLQSLPANEGMFVG